MMRRRFWGALIGAIVLFFIVFSLFPADGRASDSTDEDIEAAIIAGTDAGNAVVEAKANSRSESVPYSTYVPGSLSSARPGFRRQPMLMPMRRRRL